MILICFFDAIIRLIVDFIYEVFIYEVKFFVFDIIIFVYGFVMSFLYCYEVFNWLLN